MLIPQRLEVELFDRGCIRQKYHQLDKTKLYAKFLLKIDLPLITKDIIFAVKSKKYYFKQQFEPFAESSIKRIKRFIENKEKYIPENGKHQSKASKQEQKYYKIFVINSPNLGEIKDVQIIQHIQVKNGILVKI